MTVHKPTLGTFSREAIGGPMYLGVSSAGSTTWAGPGANGAVFVPFALDGDFLVSTVWWANGAAVAGDVDAGVYSIAGARLASCGSVAQAVTDVVQSAAVTTPVTLPAGMYYLALAASSASARFYMQALAVGFEATKSLGICSMASAFPLPSTATLAVAASTAMPLFGISRAAVV